MSKKIIKYLKNSIDEKGNYCYSLPVETTKAVIKELNRLNNIIDTILEFSFFKEECPLSFGFGDEKEEKAQDVFYEDDYCEENCNDIYKKCWMKYFEKLQELKENK